MGSNVQVHQLGTSTMYHDYPVEQYSSTMNLFHIQNSSVQLNQRIISFSFVDVHSNELLTYEARNGEHLNCLALSVGNLVVNFTMVEMAICLLSHTYMYNVQTLQWWL